MTALAESKPNALLINTEFDSMRTHRATARLRDAPGHGGAPTAIPAGEQMPPPYPDRASTVLEIRALSDLDDVSVRIANVTARLAVLRDRLRDELRPATLP